MTFFSRYFLHTANKYLSTRFVAKYLLIEIYYSCCAITYLPRPHTGLAYREVIIARIVTMYWHIFPVKTQNTLKIWFDSNEAYTCIMSGGQKHAILKRDFSYLCGVFLHKEVFFKCPLHFSRSLGVIEICDAEHTSGN